MSDASEQKPIPRAQPRYAAELLAEVEVAEQGIAHRGPREGERTLLEWHRVLRALAAEIGEPEGVRTVVFDLIVELRDGGCRVRRFDADPGPDAQDVARVIAEALGPRRISVSLRSVAADGYPDSWYPDLESFEQAAFESLDASVLAAEPGADDRAAGRN